MITNFKCQQCNKEFELDTVFMYEVCPDCNGNLFPHNHTDINHKMSTVEQLEAENASLRERTRWIPVSERLPEDGVEVLIAAESVFEPHYHIWKAYHVSHIPQWTTDNDLYYHHTNYKSITHWMPLPEAPEVQE